MKVGVDLTLPSRFAGKEDKFSRRVLTPEERADYERCDCKDRAEFLAKRWAAKEAIFKATQDSKYLEYSVLARDGGFFVKDRPEIKLSVGGDGDCVVAVAII